MKTSIATTSYKLFMWKLIGQEKALVLLKESLRQGRLSHAYLFTGPEGVGKRTLALELAKAVNCPQPDSPCENCPSCLRIESGKHADVISYNLSAQKETEEERPRWEIGVDAIRELQEIAHLSPFEGKKKVFIIEEAERLSGAASNRLLKLLEEPPPAVLIILLASEESIFGGLLPTVVSRCQKIQLSPLSFSSLEEALIVTFGLEPRRARFLSHLSQGRVGWALNYHRDEQLINKREGRLLDLVNLTNADMEARFAFALRMAEGASKEGGKILEDLSLWLTWWRDLLLWKTGSRDYIVNMEKEAFLNGQAGKLEINQIAEALFTLYRAKSCIEARANIRLVLENLMLHLPQA